MLRVGIIGAGFVAQVVHLPQLALRADRFAVCALADPDEAARRTAAARFGVPRTYERHEEQLRAGGLDAVLVCSPDGTHAAVVLDSLAAGLHVFVEKPLCLDAADADRIVTARDAAGAVVQVGYMKRHDPAYEMLRADLRASGAEVLHVSTATYDPGMAEPFAPPGMPVPAEGGVPEAFFGALVHDVNAVHGLLGPARHADVADAFARPDGSAAGGTVVLPGGTRWTMAWLRLPAAGAFAERIELLCEDGVRRLDFPAPYLLHAPAEYTRVTGRGGDARTTVTRSWREAYERQLLHFHACVTRGAHCRTPPEQAREDVALLARLHEATAAVAA
jgi:predicted dehydrogenase